MNSRKDDAVKLEEIDMEGVKFTLYLGAIVSKESDGERERERDEQPDKQGQSCITKLNKA